MIEVSGADGGELVVVEPLLADLVLGRLALAHHGKGVRVGLGLDVDVGAGGGGEDQQEGEDG